MAAVRSVTPPLSVEGRSIVVGVDEAGRGALAGPVVAGACSLPEGIKIPVRIADSKQLSAEERQTAFTWLTEHCLCGVGIVPAEEIDRIGILAATERAMQTAVAEIAERATPLYLLIDGRDKFWFDHPHSSIVRGDQTEPCISAASILAKVTRDKLMTDLHQDHPRYSFAEHKGYGTPGHFEKLVKHGTCEEHRKTFLKSLQEQRKAVKKKKASAPR